jgi:hypothetical protein
MAAMPKRPVIQHTEDDDVFRGFPEEALATYLLRLPFNPALDPGEIQSLRLFDAESTDSRSPSLEVRFRLLRLKTGGERYCPERLSAAALGLYDTELGLSDPNALYAQDEAYETWVSAETPLRRARSEPEYPARTLERCMSALRVMLTAYRLATRDQNVFPVGPASVDKWMIVGVIVPGQSWQHLSTILMRSESGIPTYPSVLAPEQLEAFNSAVGLIAANHPFVRGKDLELTAYRQAYALDDLPAAVISLQTAMESTLFDLWRMSLVDQGKTATEIRTIAIVDTSFKTLMSTVMPAILGGRWDLSNADTPAGAYWQDMYQLRNEVIHSAAIVQEWQYDVAYQAHNALVRNLAERLLGRWRTLPRTLLAFGRARGFPEGLSPSRRSQGTLSDLLAAPEPYWLASDS